MSHVPKTLDKILTQALWVEFSQGREALEMYLLEALDGQDAPELRAALRDASLQSKTPASQKA